jgi:hypothetical protein
MLETGEQIDTFTEEKLNHIKELNFEYMICAVCAKHGFLNIIKWLTAQEQPCTLDEKIFELATSNGHPNILHWLISQEPPCPWNEDICYKLAIQQGQTKELWFFKGEEITEDKTREIFKTIKKYIIDLLHNCATLEKKTKNELIKNLKIPKIMSHLTEVFMSS